MSDKYGRTFGAERSLKHDMHPTESSTPEIRALKRRQETIHRFLQRDSGCGPCCREPRVSKECAWQWYENNWKYNENIRKFWNELWNELYSYQLVSLFLVPICHMLGRTTKATPLIALLPKAREVLGIFMVWSHNCGEITRTWVAFHCF